MTLVLRYTIVWSSNTHNLTLILLNLIKEVRKTKEKGKKVNLKTQRKIKRKEEKEAMVRKEIVKEELI